MVDLLISYQQHPYVRIRVFNPDKNDFTSANAIFRTTVGQTGTIRFLTIGRGGSQDANGSAQRL